MGDPMDFSVVVTTRNRPVQLVALLTALSQVDYPRDRYEVLVADDGSDTPLEGAVAPLTGTLNLRLVRREPGGPARGRNTAARLARGKYIAFTDDDCLPEPEWLREAWKALEANPGAMAGGGTVNGLPENPYSSASQFITDLVYAHYNGGETGPRFFLTNNMAAPRSQFEQLGGFDEDYVLCACEDRDLCDRWRHAGFRLVYAPLARVRHMHRLTLASYCRQHFTYGRGAVRFHKMTALRGSGRLRDHFSFHRSVGSWFREAFRRSPGLGGVKTCGLLILWQVANAAGYLYERVKR